MTISEDQIKEALKTVKYPGFSRDNRSFGLVKGIDAETETSLSSSRWRQMILSSADDPDRSRECAAEIGRRERSEGKDRYFSAPRRAACPRDGGDQDQRGEASDRYRQRQWRSGEINCVRKSGRRAGANGAAVGLCDCDIYRAQHFAHVRLPRASDGDGRQPHHSDRTIRPAPDSMGFLLEETAPAICVDQW